MALNIKSIDMIHKPVNLDSASSLALLQKELVTDVYQRDISKPKGFMVFEHSLMQSPSTPM